jgi:hypothetical protein
MSSMSIYDISRLRRFGSCKFIWKSKMCTNMLLGEAFLHEWLNPRFQGIDPHVYPTYTEMFRVVAWKIADNRGMVNAISKNLKQLGPNNGLDAFNVYDNGFLGGMIFCRKNNCSKGDYESLEKKLSKQWELRTPTHMIRGYRESERVWTPRVCKDYVAHSDDGKIDPRTHVFLYDYKSDCECKGVYPVVLSPSARYM